MYTIKVKMPRFKAAMLRNCDENRAVGEAAANAAAPYYGVGEYTFALDGHLLPQERLVRDCIPDKARVELVLL